MSYLKIYQHKFSNSASPAQIEQDAGALKIVKISWFLMKKAAFANSNWPDFEPK